MFSISTFRDFYHAKRVQQSFGYWVLARNFENEYFYKLS